MNDCRPARHAEYALNILRIAPGDLYRVARVISNKASADFGATIVADEDAIAAHEIPFDAGYASRQQAFACADRLARAGIYMQSAARFERARDPFLSRGDR